MKLNVDEREFATILAALRYWRREGFFSFGAEHDIATDGGNFEPLETHEIEALCHRLSITTARDERTQKIIELAREREGREGETEIDDDALLSEGDDNGAYVEAWVWVDFAGTDLDKEVEADEEEDEE